MKSTNDEQESAIWDSISKEHGGLSALYELGERLKKRQKEQLERHRLCIVKQELKVKQLCKNRCKFQYDFEDKLILDLTDEGDD